MSLWRHLPLTIVIALILAALNGVAATNFTNDDMLIFSGYTNIAYGTVIFNNGWQDWGWVPNYATNNPSYNGTNSLAFAASSSWQALDLEHDPIDTTIYSNLTFRLNGGSIGGQTVYVEVEKGSDWGSQVLAVAPTNSWKQFNFSLSSLGAGNVTNLQGIEFWVDGNWEPTFYVADIRLTGLPAPPAVQISIDATSRLRTVDSRVFSVNTAAWDGDLDTANTIALLKESDNQALRWPGGSWGDIYFMTNEPQGWGSRTTNLLHVATNTGAQVFFIVNYGSGTPAQAAQWVRYCEITNHTYVKYWEVGNECYGSWEEDINTSPPYQAHDPWTYAQRFASYYQQMKAVDPTIKIGAVADVTEDASANYTNHPVVNPVTGVTHNGWTPVMLTYLRSNNVTPDFLICHGYAPNDGDTYNLLWTKIWSSNAANLRLMLNDYLGTSVAANVELNATEFGPESDKQWISLVGGLFCADTIGQILQTEFNTLLWWDLRNGQSAVTNSDNALYGWRTNDEGYFITDGGCITGIAAPPNLYPSYYYMKLLQYFARGGDTVLSTTSDYELLSAYAVQRTNGSLTLLVVNKRPDTAINAAIAISGYSPSANATVYSFGIPQDQAGETGIGSPDVAEANFSGARPAFTYSFPAYSATVLAFAPPAPKLFVSSAMQSSGHFVFQLQGLPQVPYATQSTTNVTVNHWTSIATNSSSSGTIYITNTLSPGPHYYRALWQP